MGLDQRRRPEAGSLGRRAGQPIRGPQGGQPIRALCWRYSLRVYSAWFLTIFTVGANDRIGPPRSCIWVRECCGKTRQISRRDTSPEMSGRTAYHRTPRERRPYEKPGGSTVIPACLQSNTQKILRLRCAALRMTRVLGFMGKRNDTERG